MLLQVNSSDLRLGEMSAFLTALKSSMMLLLFKLGVEVGTSFGCLFLPARETLTKLATVQLLILDEEGDCLGEPGTERILRLTLEKSKSKAPGILLLTTASAAQVNTEKLTQCC